MKITIKQGDFGYNIFQEWIRKSDNFKGRTLIASGFRDLQKAIDYARLYFYDEESLKGQYAFDEDTKTKLSGIRAIVLENYCTWLGFIENVVSSIGGLNNLLDMIKQNKPTQHIVNCYI